jgi:hypothetical protein
MEGSGHGLSKCLPGMPKEHNETLSQNIWTLCPYFKMKPPKYEAVMLVSVSQRLAKYL